MPCRGEALTENGNRNGNGNGKPKGEQVLIDMSDNFKKDDEFERY